MSQFTFTVMGNAVVDGLAHVDDDFLAFHGLTKGDSNILSVGD
ncbi:MAG: adenosine kinase, partial [Alphaproteobacteria bacterium CG_4_10_14_0_8_um_filter_53_9]